MSKRTILILQVEVNRPEVSDDQIRCALIDMIWRGDRRLPTGIVLTGVVPRLPITVTFQTNRGYTAKGQLITAQWSPDTGRVRFLDHSRMVDGVFPVTMRQPRSTDANHNAFL